MIVVIDIVHLAPSLTLATQLPSWYNRCSNFISSGGCERCCRRR
jgi:hypothetical protein